jgi:hypothetical protein
MKPNGMLQMFSPNIFPIFVVASFLPDASFLSPRLTHTLPILRDCSHENLDRNTDSGVFLKRWVDPIFTCIVAAPPLLCLIIKAYIRLPLLLLLQAQQAN